MIAKAKSVASDDFLSSLVLLTEDTLPETNIDPENGWLEYYFPIGKAYFQGQTVSFRECTIFSSLRIIFRIPISPAPCRDSC